MKNVNDTISVLYLQNDPNHPKTQAELAAEAVAGSAGYLALQELRLPFEETQTYRDIADTLARKAAEDYYDSTVAGSEDLRRKKRHTFYFVAAMSFPIEGATGTGHKLVEQWLDYVTNLYTEVSGGEEIEFPDIKGQPTIEKIDSLLRVVLTEKFMPKGRKELTNGVDKARAAMDDINPLIVYVP